ncbi:MAG: hypothetical protein Q6367_007885 [Candidatus Freyarchaeota archaeon]
MVSWNKFFDFFRHPSKGVVGEILRNIGVFESDEGYEKLAKSLTGLVGRKSREHSFCEFFCELSKVLCRKIRREMDKRTEEAREEARSETVRELGEQVTRMREQLVAETVMKAFSQDILAIIDPQTYRILKILHQGGKSPDTLRRMLNLGDGELRRRINYLKDLELIKAHYYSNNCVEYTISETGKTILDRRGSEFEKVIGIVADDRAQRLSLEAVGGDRVMAEKLESWLRGTKGRSHLATIQKLQKEYRDPKRVSQAFFARREMDTTHEKHVGVRILNHRAAGERLLLEVEKNQNEKSSTKAKYTSIGEKNRVATSSA